MLSECNDLPKSVPIPKDLLFQKLLKPMQNGKTVGPIDNFPLATLWWLLFFFFGKPTTRKITVTILPTQIII